MHYISLEGDKEKRLDDHVPCRLSGRSTLSPIHLLHRPSSHGTGHVCRQPQLSRRPMAILPGYAVPRYQRHFRRHVIHPNIPLRPPCGKIYVESSYDRTQRHLRNQLWRCYVIWAVSGTTAAFTVIALPTILLVASFGTCHSVRRLPRLTPAIVLGTIWTLQSTHPNLSLYSKEPEAFGTAYYAVSLGLNIFLTTLILARLLMHRRTILEHLPPEHAKHYLSLMTLIVESAALYSGFAIMFLVAYGLNQPINQIFLGFSQGAQVRRHCSSRQRAVLNRFTASCDVPHHIPCRQRHCMVEGGT